MTSSARPAAPAASLPRTIARVLLGLALLGAGISHLTVARQEFTAQVPEWLPVPDDAVVLTSAGALLTTVDAQEWLPVVVLAALAYLGTFTLYRRVRDLWADRYADRRD